MLKDALEKIRIIAETLPDDDPDKQEMLDIEADYSGLIEWALRKRNEYTALTEMSKTLSVQYADRKKSFEARADKMKDICGIILKSANETKYQGAAGTVSIGKKPQSVIVTDESLIPDKYFKIEKKLDKTKLNEAVKGGALVNGVTLDNGGETVIIRK